MNYTCFICGEEATKKITTVINQGDFFLCSNSKCKSLLEDQLMSLGRRLN